MFLVMSDDEPHPGPKPQLEARRLSLEPVRDPRVSERSQGRKHRRDPDSVSMESVGAKKPDQSRSAEKRK